MIQVVFYQDSRQNYLGFKTRGHAGYAQSGQDIICAAVSALVINTVNSIERLTANRPVVETNEKIGQMAVKLSEATTPEANLLFASLRYGLEDMEAEHREYIRVGFKEV